MNQQHELTSDGFHALAQPIMALRATVELGVREELSAQASQRVLQDCLPLIDRLMQDLAVFREITRLEAPPLWPCDGRALVQSCVEEMAPVAEASHISLRLNAAPGLLECNAAMLQRAMFILLDEMIASTASGGAISISLRSCEDGFLLEARPVPLRGLRLKLCHTLMQFAGGTGIHSGSDCSSITFRKCQSEGRIS
jgi:signal transduction histidine kinase